MQIWRLAGYIAGGIAVFGASFFVSLRVIDWMADVAGVVVLQTAANTHDASWPDHTMRVIIPRSGVRRRRDNSVWSRARKKAWQLHVPLPDIQRPPVCRTDL